jgi:hypothetical protein
LSPRASGKIIPTRNEKQEIEMEKRYAALGLAVGEVRIKIEC